MRPKQFLLAVLLAGPIATRHEPLAEAVQTTPQQLPGSVAMKEAGDG